MTELIYINDTSNADTCLLNLTFRSLRCSSTGLALALVYLIVTVLAVLGNIIVLVGFIVSKPLHHKKSVFVVSLTCADFLTSFFAFLIFVDIPRSDELQIVNYCIFVTSILSLTAIGIDRYIAIVAYPLVYASSVMTKNILFVLMLLWCVPVIVWILIFKFLNDYNIMDFLIGMFVIVLLILNTCVYLAIYRYVKTQEEELRAFGMNFDRVKRTRHVLKVFVVITGVMWLCWFPSCVFITVRFCLNGIHRDVLLYGMICVKILIRVNSMANPPIYWWQIPEYREALRGIVGRRVAFIPSEISLSDLAQFPTPV